MNIQAAVYAKLTSTAAVTSKISSYTGAPAVFSSWPIPIDAIRPFLVVDEPISDNEADAYGGPLGRAFVYDVGCYLDNTGSSLLAHSLKEAVRSTLHRKTLAIAGAIHIMTMCVGSVKASTDITITGRILTFRTVAREA